jgi:uncharacterized phiE125 gp8 family phage protein
MSLTVVTAPAAEPISLAEARAHLRVTDNEEDGLIAGYMRAALQFVETHLARALVNRTYDLKLDWCWPLNACGRRSIELPMPPAVSITSISYVDAEGANQTLASTEYQFAQPLQIGTIFEAYGKTWPTIRQQPEAITVRFVAGYGAAASAVPEPIRQAMLLLVGHWYANREPVIVGSTVAELPLAVDALLFPHRVFH